MELRDSVSQEMWECDYSSLEDALKRDFVDRQVEALCLGGRVELRATAPTLQDAIQEAARDLPDDCNISITVERGSAYVELTAPDRYGRHTSSIDGADKTLAEQVLEALRYAVSPSPSEPA